MKTNKSKPKTDQRAVPADDNALAAVLAEIISDQTNREVLVAWRDKAMAKAAEHYNPAIAEYDKALEDAMKVVQEWAVVNKDRFGDAQSLTIAGCRIGWRLGSWATKLLARSKWEDVVTRLKGIISGASRSNASDSAMARAAIASDFLRTVIEPAKDVMLSRRDDADAKALLSDVGVGFNQERSFYLTPNREGQAELTLKMKGGEA